MRTKPKKNVTLSTNAGSTSHHTILKKTKHNTTNTNVQLNKDSGSGKICKRKTTRVAKKRNKAILKTFELDKVKNIRKRMYINQQKMTALMKPQMIRFLQSITTTGGAYNTSHLDDETNSLTEDLKSKLNNTVTFLPATFNYYELIAYTNDLTKNSETNIALDKSNSGGDSNGATSFTAWSSSFSHHTRTVLILPNSVTKQSIEYLYKDNTFDEDYRDQIEDHYNDSYDDAVSGMFSVCGADGQSGVSDDLGVQHNSENNTSNFNRDDLEECESNAAVSEYQMDLMDIGDEKQVNSSLDNSNNKLSINPCCYFQYESSHFINEFILAQIDAFFTHDISTFVRFMELLSNYKFKCVFTKLVGANLVTVNDASYKPPAAESQHKKKQIKSNYSLSSLFETKTAPSLNDPNHFQPIVRVYVIKSDQDKDDWVLMVDNIYPIDPGSRDLTPELQTVYQDLCSLDLNKKMDRDLCEAITLTVCTSSFAIDNSNVMKHTATTPSVLSQRKHKPADSTGISTSTTTTTTAQRHKIGHRLRYEISIRKLCSIINKDNARPRSHDPDFVGNAVNEFVQTEIADMLYLV